MELKSGEKWQKSEFECTTKYSLWHQPAVKWSHVAFSALPGYNRKAVVMVKSRGTIDFILCISAECSARHLNKQQHTGSDQRCLQYKWRQTLFVFMCYRTALIWVREGGSDFSLHNTGHYTWPTTFPYKINPCKLEREKKTLAPMTWPSLLSDLQHCSVITLLNTVQIPILPWELSLPCRLCFFWKVTCTEFILYYLHYHVYLFFILELLTFSQCKQFHIHFVPAIPCIAIYIMQHQQSHLQLIWSNPVPTDSRSNLDMKLSAFL